MRSGAVDERADLGEVDDAVEARGNVAPPQAEQRAVEDDVLAAGQFRVKAADQVEDGRHASADAYPAAARPQHPRHDAQQRRLARAVRADHAERLAGLNRHADAAKRLEFGRAGVRCEAGAGADVP